MKKALTIIFSLLVLTAIVRSTEGEVVKVAYSDGRPVQMIAATEAHGTYYISLVGLARTFGASLYWSPLTRKMVFKLGGSEIKVTAMNPIVVVDDLIFNLPVMPMVEEGAIYVPVGPFTPLLDRVVPGDVRWESESRTLFVEMAQTNLSAPIIEERENGTLVTIPAMRHFDQILDTTSEPSWLHLTIYGGKLDPSVWVSLTPRGAIKKILAYQYENSAQISFLLEKGIRYKVYQTSSPERIILVLREAGPSEGLLVRREVLDPEVDYDLWAIDTIVIDPGHGGVDSGAIGPTGLKEKEVVLDIAHRLKKLLEERLHLRVILTREEDVFVPLGERAEIANRNGGKLFISIHTNANRKTNVNGVEVYFLSEARTDEAMEVARRENASIRFEEPANSVGEIKDEDFLLRDIRGILVNMASNRFLKESQDLAALIQSELVRATRLPDRGVKQAGFYVMLGTEATMPSVLVEVAFISNRYEERLLKTRSFRQKVAEALYRSVKAFKERQEQGLGTGTAASIQVERGG